MDSMPLEALAFELLEDGGPVKYAAAYDGVGGVGIVELDDVLEVDADDVALELLRHSTGSRPLRAQ